MGYLLIFIICFIGSFIQGAVSFGSAMFFMALMPFVIPLKTASVITSICGLFFGGIAFIRYRKYIDYKIVTVPIVIGFIFVPLGVYLLYICREDVLKKVIGVIIVSLAIIFLSNFGSLIKIKGCLKNQIITGASSGFLSGLTNMGGPPMVFYYLNIIKDNLIYKANIEFIFGMFAIFSTTSHILNYNFDGDIVRYIIITFFAAVSGNLLGLKIYHLLNMQLLSKFVYLMMLLLGVIVIFQP
jgi:uncharacterized protein